MVIMKIVVKSPKVAERTFVRINQRYYKCTIPMVYNNSHPFHHNTLLILPKKKNNNNNNSRTRSQQSYSKVSTCSLEFVKLLPGLDYLIKSRKKKKKKSSWKCSDSWSTRLALECYHC